MQGIKLRRYKVAENLTENRFVCVYTYIALMESRDISHPGSFITLRPKVKA